MASSCRYHANTHTPGQWWTIKGVEHPFVGSEIKYGDRVYFESHVYTNPLQFVPARLTYKTGLLNYFLITEEITSPNSQENYWIIEN